jgi:vacuolar-type H+-ATPase subunit E/Vma4
LRHTFSCLSRGRASWQAGIAAAGPRSKEDVMSDGVAGAVRAMEAEAARILEEARAEAAGILREAHREAERIAADTLPLDEVASKCNALVEAARAQAASAVREAEAEAAALGASAAERSQPYVDEIVRIVAGEPS